MTPSPTSNPDHGELVAELRAIANSLRGVTPIASSTIRKSADALAASEARAEALQEHIRCLEAGHAESRQQFADARDSLQANLHATIARAEQAEADRDALKAIVAELNEALVTAANNGGKLCDAISALEQSNTILGEKVQRAEAEVAGLREVLESVKTWDMMYDAFPHDLAMKVKSALSAAELHAAIRGEGKNG